MSWRTSVGKEVAEIASFWEDGYVIASRSAAATDQTADCHFIHPHIYMNIVNDDRQFLESHFPGGRSASDPHLTHPA